jgi:hypothetical protein
MERSGGVGTMVVSQCAQALLVDATADEEHRYHYTAGGEHGIHQKRPVDSFH